MKKPISKRKTVTSPIHPRSLTANLSVVPFVEQVLDGLKEKALTCSVKGIDEEQTRSDRPKTESDFVSTPGGGPSPITKRKIGRPAGRKNETQTLLNDVTIVTEFVAPLFDPITNRYRSQKTAIKDIFEKYHIGRSTLFKKKERQKALAKKATAGHAAGGAGEDDE